MGNSINPNSIQLQHPSGVNQNYRGNQQKLGITQRDQSPVSKKRSKGFKKRPKPNKAFRRQLSIKQGQKVTNNTLNPMILLYKIQKAARHLFKTLDNDVKKDIKAHDKKWKEDAEKSSNKAGKYSDKLRFQAMSHGLANLLIPILVPKIAGVGMTKFTPDFITNRFGQNQIPPALTGLAENGETPATKLAKDNFNNFLTTTVTPATSKASETYFNSNAEQSKYESETTLLNQELQKKQPKQSELDQEKERLSTNKKTFEDQIKNFLEKEQRHYQNS